MGLLDQISDVLGGKSGGQGSLMPVVMQFVRNTPAACRD